MKREAYWNNYFSLLVQWLIYSSTLMYFTVLGQDEGYMVKYNSLPERVPMGEAQGLYLTVYPEWSPNTGNISF